MPSRITESGRRGDGVGLSSRAAFTLIELLVVISIVSLLASIALPAFGRVRRHVESLRCHVNQRQIVGAALLYASDWNGHFQPTVATLGYGSGWNYSAPNVMTSKVARYTNYHRALSAHSEGYAEDADIFHCDPAPEKFKYLDRVVEDGDAYDNPETRFVGDPYTGNYCFYWNYVGYLVDRGDLFRGLTADWKPKGERSLMVTDYLGRNHYWAMYSTWSASGVSQRERGRYGSSHWFAGASPTEEHPHEAKYWRSKSDSIMPEVRLSAGYSDGHVESSLSTSWVPMKVIIDPATNRPYPDSTPRSPNLGEYYIPADAPR